MTAGAGHGRVAGGSRVALVAVLFAAAAIVPSATATQRDRVVRRLALDPARPVEIRATVGSVRIRGEDRGDLQVDVEREVPEHTVPEALPVTIGDDGDAVRISALHPAGGKASAIRATIDVALPRAAPLRVIEVGEGQIEITGTRNVVQAQVERGSISARDISGIIRLETSEADLRVEAANLLPGGLLRLRTVTGHIRIGLARRPADARILLHTLSGRIESSLALDPRPGFGGRLREGVIGPGQVLLSADSVRGDITLTVPDSPQPGGLR
jgi:hypothetical protein